jgi:polyhydroxyalkanoate synthesis repressor PhaR
MSAQVEITRYPNRRLYDRSRKRYVTVGDIEAMILAGQNVRVRDSKSDEDLTRMVLIQIILERHPERVKMFPVAFLHAVLRADQLALDWLTVYFGQALTVMQGITVSSGARFVPGMNFWQALLPSSGTAARPAGGPPPDEEPEPEVAGSTGEGVDGEAEAGLPVQPSQAGMVARLAELERRLAQLEGGSASDAVTG